MEPEIIVIFIVYALFGWVISEMAKKRNRNNVAWVVISLLTSPLLGVIALALVGNATEEPKVETQ